MQEITSGRTFGIYSRYVTQCFHNPMLLHNALIIEGGVYLTPALCLTNKGILARQTQLNLWAETYQWERL